MVMLGAAVAWGTGGVASAATAGRQSVPPPVATPLPPGGFSTVVTTQTVTPAGGTVGPVNVAGAMVTVHVPAGAFPGDVQITLTAPDLDAIPATSGFKVVAGVGVGVSVNGVKYSGTFSMPITIDITAPGITTSSMVGMWNGSAFVADAASTVTAGSASITMDSDAAFVVESPTTSTTKVPGATAPTTGEPFLGEGLLAGLLVLGGAGAMFAARRRRTASTGPTQELPVGEAGWGAASTPARPLARAERSDDRAGGEKLMHGSGTWPSAVGMVIGALTAASLAACSSGGSASGQQAQPAAIKPQQILPAPKNLLAVGQPQPNGTLWALAGTAADKELFDINLTNGSAVGSVPVSRSARSVTESLGGVIGLALGAAGKGALDLINGTTGKLTKTIRLGAPARYVIAGSDGATFYVLDSAAKTAAVTIVNSRNGNVQGTVKLPPGTVSIVPDSQGASVYALQPDGRISQVAIAGGETMTTFPTGPGARSISLSPDGSTLYVLKNTGRAPNVAEVDVATEVMQRVLPAPRDCLQVLVSADGSQLYQLVSTSSYGNIQIVKS